MRKHTFTTEIPQAQNSVSSCPEILISWLEVFCFLTRHDLTSPPPTKLGHELRTEKTILLKTLPCGRHPSVLLGYSICSSTPSPALLAGTLPKP